MTVLVLSEVKNELMVHVLQGLKNGGAYSKPSSACSSNVVLLRL